MRHAREGSLSSFVFGRLTCEDGSVDGLSAERMIGKCLPSCVCRP